MPPFGMSQATHTEDQRTALLIHAAAERQRLDAEAQAESEMQAVRELLESITDRDDE